MKHRTTGQQIFAVINYGILILASLMCILPFVHLLAVSFSESAAVSAGKVGLWPVNFTLQSYSFAFSNGKFVKALLVSLERVALGVGVNMVLMILTAYPLSRSKEQLLDRKSVV